MSISKQDVESVDNKTVINVVIDFSAMHWGMNKYVTMYCFAAYIYAVVVFVDIFNYLSCGKITTVLSPFTVKNIKYICKMASS